MALFVGRISRDVRDRDLEDAFSKFGKLKRCDLKGSFGFVTFEDERDAEDALKEMDNKDLCGTRIHAEWAKVSGKSSRTNRGREDSEEKCYECGGRGHLARDCRRRAERYRGRSRSRSRSRSPRQRSRSPREGKRKQHSRSRSRSPKADKKRRSRSRSPQQDRKPARERSPDSHGNGSRAADD